MMVTRNAVARCRSPHQQRPAHCHWPASPKFSKDLFVCKRSQSLVGWGVGSPVRLSTVTFPGPGRGWPRLSLPGSCSSPGQVADETSALTAAAHLHCAPTAHQACALCSEDDSCSWKPPGRWAVPFPVHIRTVALSRRPGSARLEEPARLRDWEAQSTASAQSGPLSPTRSSRGPVC